MVGWLLVSDGGIARNFFGGLPWLTIEMHVKLLKSRLLASTHNCSVLRSHLKTAKDPSSFFHSSTVREAKLKCCQISTFVTGHFFVETAGSINIMTGSIMLKSLTLTVEGPTRGASRHYGFPLLTSLSDMLIHHSPGMDREFS